MNVLRLLPVVVSALVLAAHFFRGREMVGVAASLALLVLLFFPRRWAARLVQAGLILGAVEWGLTAVHFVQIRQAHGLPWTRLAIILGAVALFTALSALVFRARALRQRYRLD